MVTWDIRFGTNYHLTSPGSITFNLHEAGKSLLEIDDNTVSRAREWIHEARLALDDLPVDAEVDRLEDTYIFLNWLDLALSAAPSGNLVELA